jgi:hypothetical protein
MFKKQLQGHGQQAGRWWTSATMDGSTLRDLMVETMSGSVSSQDFTFSSTAFGWFPAFVYFRCICVIPYTRLTMA